MASSKSDLSFQDIVRASRQKKENEKFAQSVFGRDRRSSAPGALGKRRAPAIPSLASRVGVTKPTQRAKSSRDLKAKANPMLARPSPLKQEVVNGGSLSTRRGTAPPVEATAQSFNIRGLAGPAVVMGSNFAPGTTAADIQSAMEPVGGQMQSCRIVTARPTVIAEMVFSDRSGAEAVIETFNNQRADGRLLHIYLKTGPGGQNLAAPSAPRAETEPSPQPQRPQGPRFDEYDDYSQQANDGVHAEPAYQDGRYGFDAPQEAKQEMDVEMDEQRDDRGNERHPERQYNDDRRDDRRDSHRPERSYRPQNGEDRRFDRGPREGRLYSDRPGYRPRAGYR